jgi:hypothetical protein
MACGCGGAQAAEKFTVQAGDGTVKKFSTRPEAEAYAAKNGGGIVKRV